MPPMIMKKKVSNPAKKKSKAKTLLINFPRLVKGTTVLSKPSIFCAKAEEALVKKTIVDEASDTIRRIK